MKKVYVILDVYFSEDNGEDIRIKVYSNKEDAQQAFDELVADAMNKYSEQLEVCDIGNTYASFYDEGRYLEFHHDLEWQEQDIIGTSI